MKAAVCLTLALFPVALTMARAELPKTAKSQEMSLRLELFVDDMQRSADFYTNVLGFERLKGSADYAPVRSGSVTIGLGLAANLPKTHYFHPEVQANRRGLGAEIVLEVDDVRGFFEKVKATGYKKIISPLSKRPWGATDFRVADPDGYYLRITSR